VIFSLFLTFVFLFMAVYSFAFLRPPALQIPLCLAYLVGIYFVWDPDVSTVIASYFGIGRGLDFILILLSISIVNALVLLTRHINAQHRAITKLTRHFALMQARRPSDR